MVAARISGSLTRSGRPRRRARLLGGGGLELAAQRLAELLAAGEALLGLLGEQLLDDEAQPLGAVGGAALDRLGLRLRDLEHQRGEPGTGEGGFARHHLVEHDAEREEIRAVIDGKPERLFGAHIAGRADHLADLRAHQLAGIGVADPRDAEIEQLGGQPVVGEQDVRGLDVAVHDAARMRIGERVGHLHAERQDALIGHAALRLEHLVERPAGDQLHRDIGDAIGLADVVDRRDIGMAERAGRGRLAQEAAPDFGIAAIFRLERLDRDDPVDPGVVRAEHLRHRAFADARVDPVAAEHRHAGFRILLHHA